MKNIIPVNASAKLSGMYKFSVESADGTVKESGWIDNLILNSGLDLLGNFNTYASIAQTLQVGTGTVPTDVTQTRLQSFLAIANIQLFSSSNKGAPLYQTETIHTYTFAQGAVVGNITEVGVGLGADTNLFSRTLITDEKGVPTALTVVALDRLTVYYKLTLYATIADSAGSFIINNITYNYVSRVANVRDLASYVAFFYPYFFSRLGGATIYNETCTGLADVTTTLNGLFGYADSFTNEIYSPGSFQAKASAVFGITQGNGPIKGAVCNFGVYTQFVFTPSIPKSNTSELVLRFTFSWGRG